MLPTDHSAAPTALLADLRAARAAGSDAHAHRLAELGLHPMTGGRNNAVYAWSGPAGAICVKLYRTDERRRVEREWHALTLLAEHWVPRVPRPLWYDPHPDSPALGMTLLPGTAIPDLPDHADALGGLVETWHQIHSVPLTGELADLVRIDSATHYVARIADLWAKQLGRHRTDPLTPELQRLLDAWWDSHDSHTLAEPQSPTLSRGDANLLNWLYDSATAATYSVDFEFSGYSDTAFDVADLVEHISARMIDDGVWATLVPRLGIVGADTIRRFHAAQRTCALRWLAVLWKQREARAEEFAEQLDRVRRLQQHESRLAEL